MTRDAAVQKWLGWGIVGLVAIMPFHALLVTWLSTATGHRPALQAWKELLLILLVVLGIIYTLGNQEAIKRLARPINYLALTFVLVGLIVSLASHQFGSRNFWFGLKIDVEFLVAFVLAQLAASEHLESMVKKVLIVTSCLVAGFGLLQIFILPKDFLAHFGYNASTILPYAQVDPAVKSTRILSTLGGPNQLGAFMILPVCLFAFLLVRRRKVWTVVPLVASLLVLINTFSRSAWLGVAVAIIATLVVGLSWRWVSLGVLVLVVAALLTFNVSKAAISQQNPIQYFLLHGRILNGQVQGSDFGRRASLEAGLNQVKQYPGGRGFGSTGPATLKTETANVTEDFYLQLAIEVGLLGLGCFLAMQILLGVELGILATSSELAPALFGTMLGIGIVNLFLHGWADSSTALVYWVSAGAVIGWRKPHV